MTEASERKISVNRILANSRAALVWSADLAVFVKLILTVSFMGTAYSLIIFGP